MDLSIGRISHAYAVKAIKFAIDDQFAMKEKLFCKYQIIRNALWPNDNREFLLDYEFDIRNPYPENTPAEDGSLLYSVVSEKL